MTEALPGMGVLSTLELAGTVWGIDPSTVRVSVGIISPGPQIATRTLSLPKRTDSHRFALAHAALVPWLSSLADSHPPAAVLVEQPFAQGRNVHPSSQQMLGALLAALGLVMPNVALDVIGPPSWKAKALGKGRGFAKPPEYLVWAQTELGYRGTLEDEAAALGIAVARALMPLPRILRGSQAA